MSDDAFKEEFKRFRRAFGEFAPGEVIDFGHAEPVGASQVALSTLPTPLSARASDRLGLLPVDKWKVFTLATAPGLYVIPNPFQDGGQHRWVKQCLVTYPCKPNVCNLDAHVVRPGDGRLWPRGTNTSSSMAESVASRDGSEVSRDGSEVSKDVSEVSRDDPGIPRDEDSQVSSYGDLLHKLRWVTLGYHYDWTAKVYHIEHRSPFPEDLAELSTFILAAVGFANFVPEAAIVNYYNLGSTLSGHTDHSEHDLSRPLLSISFGQSAVFLIGGTTKQVRPEAILLRSGDVIVMSGACRLAYHGVPKILPPPRGVAVPHCLSQEALQRCHEGAQLDRERQCWCLCGETSPVATPECGSMVKSQCPSCSSVLNSWTQFAAYLSYSRININVRQVVPH